MAHVPPVAQSVCFQPLCGGHEKWAGPEGVYGHRGQFTGHSRA